MPKVSVCIPTYNHGAYLRNAIHSVLNNPVKDLEIIIADNASTDQTVKVIGGIKDRRIRYYRLPHTIGMVDNWNYVLSLVRGEYIKLMCADDLLNPSCLGYQLRFLETNRHFGMVGTRCEFFQNNVSVAPIHGNLGGPSFIGRDGIFRMLLGNPFWSPSCVLFRRYIKGEKSSFNPVYTACTDWDFWLNLVTATPAHLINLKLTYYRRHNNSQTVHVPIAKQLDEQYKIALEHLFRNGFSFHETAKVIRTLSLKTYQLFKAIRKELLPVILHYDPTFIKQIT